MSTLDLIIIILFVAWLSGYGFGFGGDAIHLLIVIVFVLFIVRLFQNRRI